jgi:hypothetical protein
MAQVLKYRCDFCQKEVEDTALEPGWLRFNGSVSRSWGVRAHGRSGDAGTDFIEKSSEFCSTECLVARLDALRKEKRGPDPMPVVIPDPDKIGAFGEPDPFKEPPKKQPWEDPLPDHDDEPRVRIPGKKA